MKIYFAGSITGGRDDMGTYAVIIGLLRQYGVVLTEHVGDGKITSDGETQLTPKAIFERDVAWLDSADAVVADVTTTSLGVGYELGRAEANGKPILCLFNTNSGKKLSSMIRGNEKNVIAMYSNESDIETALKKFFDKLRV
jgi:nucleoside 2-deoxyribosyltransferase